MQGQSVTVKKELVDKKKTIEIFKEIRKITEPWHKEIGKIVNKHMETNPLELSESMTTAIKIIIQTLTPEPKELENDRKKYEFCCKNMSCLLDYEYKRRNC